MAANPHKELRNKIRIRLNQRGDTVVWANESGVAEHVHSGRYVRYGVGKGGADLLGICCTDGVGIFFALEVKTGSGRLTDEQQNFLSLVRRYGGFACVVRSVEDADAAIARLRNGEHE